MNYPPGTPDLMTELADDGYSDFYSDYEPYPEQLLEWANDDPDIIVEIVTKNNFAPTLADFVGAWKVTHEQTIEAEWDERNEQ